MHSRLCLGEQQPCLLVMTAAGLACQCLPEKAEAPLAPLASPQPVIVLATCHAPADGTPANLVQFFAGPAVGAAAGAAGGQPEQQQQTEQQPEGRLGQLLVEAEGPPDAAAVAAPSIVRMQQPCSSAWQQAAAAAAEQVAHAVATQAALLLHQRLVAAASSGDSSSEPAGEASAPERGREQPPAAAAAAGAAAGSAAAAGAPPQCNTAELEQGLRLFDQLLSFQRWLGAALEQDQVAGLDRWVARLSRRRTGNSAVQCGVGGGVLGGGMPELQRVLGCSGWGAPQ